jgi:hypothetical protein
MVLRVVCGGLADIPVWEIGLYGICSHKMFLRKEFK